MSKFRTNALIYSLFICVLVSAKEYHVSKTGSDSNVGSALKPFSTISQAAKTAYAGDTITVHSGVYREWINPIRGGESDAKRIVYRAAPSEKVEIKGSEIITGWKKEKNGIWKVIIPNTFFGNYNPYQDSIHGDWFKPLGRIHHTGEVFLNRKSLFEMEILEKVIHAVAKKDIKDSIGSKYTWYCESDDVNTTIWANFQKFNPNKEMVEISTRKTCFYPEKPGINYITISGFHFSQAATQWAPPTAEQIGMIATHWNKGWIIENNVISDSKCNGISLGKDRSSDHNVLATDSNTNGPRQYVRVIFNALKKGWNKAQIGSHIVRNNTIFNCEQTAICGSFGAAFSTIENNHIYNIWAKRLFQGVEIAGIKLHGPIDVVVRKNRIHGCGRGLWFDWMTQGSRISSNLFYDNDVDDIYIEVSHGPYLVDNNLLLSPLGINNWSQGGAYVHNMIVGGNSISPQPVRTTPYHLPHSTEIAGYAAILGGDDRFFNNIFIGKADDDKKGSKFQFGTEIYNGSKHKVWISDNLYYNEAKPYNKETNPTLSTSYNPEVKLVEAGENVYLHLMLDDVYYQKKGKIITTDILGKAKLPEMKFENADGTALTVDKDYFGNIRTLENNTVGAFTNLGKGEVVLKVW